MKLPNFDLDFVLKLGFFSLRDFSHTWLVSANGIINEPKFLHIFNLSSQVNASAAVDPVTHLL